ncbi:hypothetical protein [Alkalihalobacillus sp. AL-G]|uniref:hypothetical protein n=1 Tax=Alkalihalobacillus sp. AL-G TaxID=2926399 RepID=UPI00272C1A18|nr:hypothetical protein [Alkalihalobacillus sp. AL-G]WLD92472.1 hypothetical protein MOJ78_15845 [Alkalihalobacillus sp. AL-G]
MTSAVLSCFAFILGTVGVCALVKRFISVDTIDHDVYHLWEEYGYTKNDYLNNDY